MAPPLGSTATAGSAVAPEGASKCPFAASLKEASSRAQDSAQFDQRLVQHPEPDSAPTLQSMKGRPFIERNVSNMFDGADPLVFFKVLMPPGASLGVGMLLAGLLCTFLPTSITLALAACLILPPLIRTALRTSGVLPTPGAKDIVKGAMTDAVEGEFCVFILGARSNTASKLDLGFKTVGDNFTKIIQELERLPAECGYLGGDSYVTTNLQRGSHFTSITYWRSYEHMIRYTHDRKLAHTSAMKAVIDTVYKSPNTGIWHETYIVKPGQHESIYLNCPPVGLGAAAGLMPATGPHKTSRGRIRENQAPAPESITIRA